MKLVATNKQIVVEIFFILKYIKCYYEFLVLEIKNLCVEVTINFPFNSLFWKIE